MPPKIPTEDLLAELRRLSDELGRSPKTEDMTECGGYGTNTYVRRFGSWNAALEEANLEINIPSETTEEEIISDIQRVAEKISRVPKLEDIREHGKHSTGPYRTKFDGWTNALEEAGFEPNMHYNVSCDDAIDAIIQAGDKLGRQPTYDDLGDSVKYSSSVYEDKFGSWNAALVEAGFDPWTHPEGKDHPHWKGGSVEVECALDGCEETRLVPPALVDKTRFCSRECHNKWRVDSGALKGENNPSWNGGLVTIECERDVCSNTRDVVPAQEDRSRFCSKDCLNQWLRETDENVGENHPQYTGGVAPYGRGWTERKKRQVRIRDQARCQDCGRTEAEQLGEFGRKHPVHHIRKAKSFDDPDSRNALRNLITLCDECHPKWEKMSPLRPQTASD